MWWSGISKHIIQPCPTCVKESSPHKEPLIPTDLLDYPRQIIGPGIFIMNGANYLVAVDYFSRYFETIKLKFPTSSSVIEALISIFSRCGISETVISDNGPQYSSYELANFALSYKLMKLFHVTSSPLFPQSNGQAKRIVQTVKNYLRMPKIHIWLS